MPAGLRRVRRLLPGENAPARSARTFAELLTILASELDAALRGAEPRLRGPPPHRQHLRPCRRPRDAGRFRHLAPRRRTEGRLSPRAAVDQRSPLRHPARPPPPFRRPKPGRSAPASMQRFHQPTAGLARRLLVADVTRAGLGWHRSGCEAGRAEKTGAGVKGLSPAPSAAQTRCRPPGTDHFRIARIFFSYSAVAIIPTFLSRMRPSRSMRNVVGMPSTPPKAATVASSPITIG